MSVKTTEMNCGRVIDLLDLFLDRELTADDRTRLTAHVETCGECAGELNRRSQERARLRSAVGSIAAPAELRERIVADIRRRPEPQPRSHWQSWGAGIAAAAMLTAGLGVAYQLGHIRLTTASRESYFTTISQRVVSVMRVGLGDHVHCAVFRKYPRQAPPPETIAADMGPEFLPLVQMVRDRIPGEQRVVMAHRCRYHGRPFVHLAMIDGKHLASLVIAERNPGETFQNSGLVPAMSDAGLPIYHSDVQRFQIDGFQTGGHLVYLVSDLPRDASERIMASLARPVHEFLNKLEL